MGFVFDLLTLPVLGAPKMVHWLATTVAQEAMREYLDEGRIRGQLLQLQQQYDTGEIQEDEYGQQEDALLAHLGAIREAKVYLGWQE